MSDLDKENKLDADSYKQLLDTIPKEERESFDKPTNVLINLLKKGLYWFHFMPTKFIKF